MFNTLLKVSEEAKKKDVNSEFAKFLRDFAKYEEYNKSTLPLDKKTKDESLFGRSYKSE